MEIEMKSVLLFLAVLLFTPAQAADVLLGGSVTSFMSEKMSGVTVSAKPEGGTVTTTVYTDKAGNYYFAPLPEGKYRVWAQALGFRTEKIEVDLSENKWQSFKLKNISDPEQLYRQLPGNLALDALPEDSEHD